MAGAAEQDTSTLPVAGTAIHHTVVVVRDLEASLRFYRDGLGLEELQDRQVEGDWPGLFDAPSRRLRAVFLGDAQVRDDHAGVLELNVFDHDVPAGSPPAPPRTGFFLLSFFVDVEATLSRLAALGLGGPPRRVAQPTANGPITIAAVRDPDGLLVLLTPGSITQGTGHGLPRGRPAGAPADTRYDLRPRSLSDGQASEHAVEPSAPVADG